MTRYIDEDSRDILEFRPNIQRFPPAVEPGLITPLSVPGTTLEEIENDLDKVKKLAQAVNLLAAATQAKADLRAEGMIISLNPSVDADAITAMKRVYPTADPTKITYEQYKACKENQRLKGESIGRQVLIDDEEIKKARLDSKLSESKVTAGLGGYGTAAARDGGLRPELDKRGTLIEPINILELQDVLIKILVNFIWKNFIKPGISSIGGIVGIAMSAVPDEIIPLPEGFKIADITATGTPVLGERPPKYLTIAPPQVPQNVNAAKATSEREKEQ